MAAVNALTTHVVGRRVCVIVDGSRPTLLSLSLSEAVVEAASVKLVGRVGLSPVEVGATTTDRGAVIVDGGA